MAGTHRRPRSIMLGIMRGGVLIVIGVLLDVVQE